MVLVGQLHDMNRTRIRALSCGTILGRLVEVVYLYGISVTHLHVQACEIVIAGSGEPG
jgi:hypothetical protein